MLLPRDGAQSAATASPSVLPPCSGDSAPRACGRSPRQPALFQRQPALRDALAWVPLGSGPTRIELAAELGARLGTDELWLKREDQSGLHHGGNKVRKLEWLLGDAVRRRCRSVLCVGAVGSNHVVATTFYARRLGLDAHAVVLPQRMHDYARRNLLAALSLGCRLHFARDEAAAGGLMLALAARLWAKEGARPSLLWPGGSSPRGVLGSVELGLEIAAQVRAGELPEPTYLFVPLASCGTLAGLVLGLRLAGLGTIAVGVRVYARRVANETTVLALADGARRLLARHGPSLKRLRLGRGDFRVLHDHAGPGYAEPTAEAAHALQLARDYGGIELEETYSAKALAGLRSFMAAPERRGQRALFVCTFNSRPLDAFVAAAPPRESVARELQAYLAADGA